MKIQVGDKVKYSRAFLQSAGMHTGDIPFASGVVRKLQRVTPDFILATIDWNTPEAPAKVNVKNLVSDSRLHLEAPNPRRRVGPWRIGSDVKSRRTWVESDWRREWPTLYASGELAWDRPESVPARVQRTAWRAARATKRNNSRRRRNYSTKRLKAGQRRRRLTLLKFFKSRGKPVRKMRWNRKGARTRRSVLRKHREREQRLYERWLQRQRSLHPELHFSGGEPGYSLGRVRRPGFRHVRETRKKWLRSVKGSNPYYVTSLGVQYRRESVPKTTQRLLGWRPLTKKDRIRLQRERRRFGR
jgi:hypothetical protein